MKSLSAPVMLSVVLLVNMPIWSFADSVSLGFSPVGQSVALGNPATVDLTISRLGDHTAPSLGTFDVTVSFNSTVLAFNTFTFGDPILGDQLDLFGLGSLTIVTPTTGSVGLFELSFDSATDINSLQAGSFVLGALTFSTLQSGTSPLSITVNALGDADGSGLPFTTKPGSVTVTPEPKILPLTAIGLLALVFLSRREYSSSGI